jgi:hypothetical protein
MNQYTLTSGVRTLLLAFIATGVLCLGITWFTDDVFHTRFWSNILHNSVFFTGISLMACFFIAASILAYAGWYTAFKRVFEAAVSFLPIGIGFMVLIGIANYLQVHHLYHWADPASVAEDPILQGKASFLNTKMYLILTLVFGAAYVFFIQRIKKLSVQEDNGGFDADFKIHRKQRTNAAILLPIIGFTSVILIWQWIMSVDAHWYSTMFAWYCLASFFVALMCLVTLALVYLRANGYYANLSQHHIHDMGKFIFAFSIFWTYLWFSQFMLIWYANIGEETIYFKERYDNYPVLFFANLAVNFVLPFIVLLRNDTKRKVGTLSFVAITVFIFHWLDFFLMVKPGVLHTAHELSGGHSEDHGASHSEAGHDAVVNAEHMGTEAAALVAPTSDHAVEGGLDVASHTVDSANMALSHAPVSSNADVSLVGESAHSSADLAVDSMHSAVSHVTDVAHASAAHGADHASTFVSGFTMPGLLELGTMLGFFGLFALIVLNSLTKSQLTPKNDPYLEESLHHHV